MQMISEYVPIGTYQKFNKLASFHSIEIAMEEKTRAFKLLHLLAWFR